MQTAHVRTLRFRVAMIVAVFVGVNGVSVSNRSAVAAPPPARWAIRNVRVFDGERVLDGTTVLVDGERIVAVGQKLVVSPGMRALDGRGKTLLPGLIDSHAHVAAAASLQQAALFGVTTVLDMGCNKPELGRSLQAQAERARGGLAALRFAGYAVTAPHGHCTEYGLVVPTLERSADADRFVAARKEEGSDYIKIILEDGSAYGMRSPTLDRAEVTEVVIAAHKRNMLTIAHISTLAAALEAIEAGVDGLAHTFIDRAPDVGFGDFAAAHHIFVIPTLSVVHSSTGVSVGTALVDDAQLRPFLLASAIDGLRAAFSTKPGRLDFGVAVDSIHALQKAQVPLLAGTDAPNPGTAYGVSLHGELEQLVAAGLTPSAALTAATAAPARAFHMNDRGRIAPGLRADLLLVDGDPTREIRATRAIERVWIGGLPVDRGALFATLRAAETESAGAPTLRKSDSGLISDFEALDTAVRFGAGWSPTTDALRGGSSSAALVPVTGGAHASLGALRVEGKVGASSVPVAWAGAMFSPGSQPFATADVSFKKELAFWTRGDNKSYTVMLFTQSNGFTPIVRSFRAGSDWSQVVFPLSSFEGVDGHDLIGIAFIAGPALGSFAFFLDDVELR